MHPFFFHLLLICRPLRAAICPDGRARPDGQQRADGELLIFLAAGNRPAITSSFHIAAYQNSQHTPKGVFHRLRRVRPNWCKKAARLGGDFFRIRNIHLGLSVRIPDRTAHRCIYSRFRSRSVLQAAHRSVFPPYGMIVPQILHCLFILIFLALTINPKFL